MIYSEKSKWQYRLSRVGRVNRWNLQEIPTVLIVMRFLNMLLNVSNLSEDISTLVGCDVFSCQLPVYDQSKDRNSSNISLYSWFMWFYKVSLQSLKAKLLTELTAIYVPFIDWCQSWTSQWSETWAVWHCTLDYKRHILLISKLELKELILLTDAALNNL